MTFASIIKSTGLAPTTWKTPVTTPLKGQVANQGGGYSYAVDPWTSLDRFLILGTERGTYYANEQTLNAANLTVVERLLQEDGIRVVDRCIEISQAGRAKNNDYALLVFAIAISKGDDATKRYASNNLHLVARTGTHLMHFTAFANGLRGWGKNLKRAVQNWYNAKTPDTIAYQAIKYQSRDGWSQRDLLRLSHVNAGGDELRNTTYRYIVKGRDGMVQGEAVPAIIVAFEQAKTADEKTLIKLITDHHMSHEMIPNEMKNRPAVWEALVQHMGTTALIRNMNKMTQVGLIGPFSDTTRGVIQKLNDLETLKRDRVHPLSLLIARKQYATGHGSKGSLVWNPIAPVVKALEDSFYLSFGAIKPTGKNIMKAIDVSASMNNPVSGVENLTCREAAAVMAMVTLKVEPWAEVYGFDHKFRNLGITANDNLEVVCQKTFSRNFGSTDASLPPLIAEQQGWKVHAFEIYTDNEVNTGTHPANALRSYRSKSGISDAKMIVCGMAVNNFTIADPKDKNMLDVVGFDTAAPQLMTSFIEGSM